MPQGFIRITCEAHIEVDLGVFHLAPGSHYCDVELSRIKNFGDSYEANAHPRHHKCECGFAWRQNESDVILEFQRLDLASKIKAKEVSEFMEDPTFDKDLVQVKDVGVLFEVWTW